MASHTTIGLRLHTVHNGSWVSVTPSTLASSGYIWVLLLNSYQEKKQTKKKWGVRQTHFFTLNKRHLCGRLSVVGIYLPIYGIKEAREVPPVLEDLTVLS